MHLHKDREPWGGFVLPLPIPDSSPRTRKILIVGAGIAGIASALALSHELKPHEPNLQITIFERHDVLSTSGGAINLTPVAQRHLDRLGVLSELDRQGADGGANVDAIELFSSRSGRSLGSIDFTDGNGNGVNGYKGRRVMRIVLSLALLSIVERHPNIQIVYGKKLASVTENYNDQTILHFEDNTSAAGDLVLGCDGVHSALRTSYVDPGRISEYTGLSFIQTTIETPPPPPPQSHSPRSTRPSTGTSTKSNGSSSVRGLRKPPSPSMHTPTTPNSSDPSPTIATMHQPPFTATGLALSRNGDLIASYCDRTHTTMFLAAIVEINKSLLPRYRLDPSSSTPASYSQYITPTNNDPRRRLAIHAALQSEIHARFGNAGNPWLRDIANLNTNWMLYPVYQVPPGGKWSRGRALLLGDAAHAMPPRDESAAYALDDAIMFARILAHHRDEPLECAFSRYESVRRGVVEEAFSAASRMWETHRDMGVLEGRWKELKVPRTLWKGRGVRDAAWRFDAFDVK
ncbi:FAD-dependent oxidoreductase [Aspergillus lucknowensis]|uniref:FAD-binding domain-containing protein n=1 Tax=Aspergillus lucknowensis TaxID=176173 RepID=A0ABR4LU79_9EURO